MSRFRRSMIGFGILGVILGVTTKVEKAIHLPSETFPMVTYVENRSIFGTRTSYEFLNKVCTPEKSLTIGEEGSAATITFYLGDQPGPDNQELSEVDRRTCQLAVEGAQMLYEGQDFDYNSIDIGFQPFLHIHHSTGNRHANLEIYNSQDLLGSIDIAPR